MAHSKTLARSPGVFNFAKRLECGAFTAAIARTTRRRTNGDLCPCESGAEVTALQTLTRLPGVFSFAKRLGVRAALRRFLGHGITDGAPAFPMEIWTRWSSSFRLSTGHAKA